MASIAGCARPSQLTGRHTELECRRAIRAIRFKELPVPDEPTEKPETSAPPIGDEHEPRGEHPEEADAAQEPEDAMSPEAIAKRVAALGGDDEVEKLARDEEIKLAERRAKAGGKGGKGKSGLEAAASKRLQKIGGKVPPKRVAYAADADVLLGGAGPFGRWFRANQKAITAIGALSLIALIGGGTYAWWTQRTETAASSSITLAVDDEGGRIGDPAKDDDDSPVKDPRPVFKTEADRRDSALAKYREVEAKYKGTGAAYLSRLEEGSLLLDKGDTDLAITALTDASQSPLAAADAEVKGRALEGLGFAYEAKAAAAPAEKDKWLDEAAQRFRALENTDVKGFKELGMYHQARVAETKGDKDKAVQLLKSLHERLSAPGDSHQAHQFVYLETVSEDRLRQLDPTALPPKARGQGPGGAPGGGGGGKLTEEQIQKLMEQLRQQQSGAGGGAPGSK
jgi:predicted ribosomally synthesized peptide with SipW-like signal peptide